MATRFTSASLDLSRIDRSALWPDISFNQIVTERLEELKQRLVERGIDYDTGTIEAEVGAAFQEAGGVREQKLYLAIQRAQAEVLLAFSEKGFLDRLGDMHGTARLSGESDDRYRARIQLAPEAFASAGTTGGYIYHAVSVSTDIRDVGLTVINKGTMDVAVEITVLSSIGDGEPSEALIRAVHSQLFRPDIKLATDTLMVRGARIAYYDVVAKLQIQAGPDPVLVRTAALSALNAVAERYKRIGGDVPVTALVAALYVAGVERVVPSSPLNDISCLRFQAAHMRSATITVEVIGA